MKIAIVDRFNNGPHGFSTSIGDYLAQAHTVNFFTECTRNLEDFDVVHFDWADDVTLRGIALLSKLPVPPRITVRLHAYEVFEPWMQEIAWQAVDELIFVSEEYMRFFEELNLPNRPKNMRVIHHGIDLNRFRLTKHSGFNILSVGFINFKKGPQLLAQVAMAVPDREVHVYGDFQCDRSRRYFENLKLSNLKFFPHTTSIERVMGDSQYEFILSTSLGESFHLAVAEGMACGLRPLVHEWPGAADLWPVTWRSMQDFVELLNTAPSAQESHEWIASHYNAKEQLSLLAGAIAVPRVKTSVRSDKHATIAACMITRDGWAGLVRALKSCCKYIDAAFIAVDSRDTTGTFEKVPDLLKELGLKGKAMQFTAPEPWDFSYARNIAHETNDCDWALVLDDDEFIRNPEEIPDAVIKFAAVDAIDLTCGMGLDEYGNIGDTWMFPRILKRHIRWANPRHNLPANVKKDARWLGDLIIIDDKSIKPTPIRTARSAQRNTNIEVFRKRVDENPLDTRSIFYLATAYREAALYWEAIHWYKQYLATGGWDEERWQACFDMALCNLSLRRYSDARDCLHTAIREKWNRAESFILMGDIFYSCEGFNDAIIWYELGCALPIPEDAQLFVTRSVYEWERYDKLSMAYSKVKNWEAAINCANIVLQKRPNDPRVLNNVKVWQGQLEIEGG